MITSDNKVKTARRDRRPAGDAPDGITIHNAPAIPGLSFRHFRGESDYPLMSAVVNASADADRIERADTPEEIARAYANLTNSDPYRDMIFAEIDGHVAGYGRGWWQEEVDGPLLYGLVGFLEPAWRRKGIGTAMSRWLESRMREVAADHAPDRPKYFQTFTDISVTGMVALRSGGRSRLARDRDDLVRGRGPRRHRRRASRPVRALVAGQRDRRPAW